MQKKRRKMLVQFQKSGKKRQKGQKYIKIILKYFKKACKKRHKCKKKNMQNKVKFYFQEIFSKKL